MIGNLIAGALIHPFFNSFVDLTDNENWEKSQRKLKRAGLLQKETIIRISFAYLFRIKVDGKYFLVKNSRSGKYQPVGGAYKFYKEEADYLRDNIPVENDDRIPVDQITKLDYRLLVKNKLLRKFIRRFNKTLYREQITDLSREFVEEIFFTGILNKDTFGKLSYNYCGRHMTNVEFGNIFKIYELLLADVVEVQLSHEQEELFRILMGKDSDEYQFVTASEINALGVDYGTNNLADTIANHTPKILSDNTEELINRNKYKKKIEIDSENMYSKEQARS
nr:hypothetical protein [Carnobacterium maltaromaticum]